MQKFTRKLPDRFRLQADKIVKESERIEGFLSPREMFFLVLLAAYPTAKGEILEIGSFKGKSTVILAKAAQLSERSIIHAVDPMTAPSSTDPNLHGAKNSLEDFQKNIVAHNVADIVKLHQTTSLELAKTWTHPLRLLWIDGDHTYKGTKIDFEGFAPHLADKGMVAIHDVLHEFEGGARVFNEFVLQSANFGACGFCGSIAWAQFRAKESDTRQFRRHKTVLQKKLDRLLPYLASNKTLRGFEKKKYKFFRALIPHRSIDAQKWIENIL